MIFPEQPTVYIKVGAPGEEPSRLPPEEIQRILSFEIDLDEKKADELSIDLDNFDLGVFDNPLWAQGARIQLSWGYPGRMTPAREFTVQNGKHGKKKVSASKGGKGKAGGAQGLVYHLKAHGIGLLMNKLPRDRSWERVTRSNVAAQIAEENGYASDQQDIEDTKVVLDHITQASTTDANLLLDMARREGFQWYVDSAGFHFHKRRVSTKPLRRLEYYTDPTEPEMWDLTLDIGAAAGRPGAINTAGIDPDTKAPIGTRADNNNASGDEGLSSVLEAISGRDGTSTEQARGTGVGSEVSLPTTETSQAAAEREAKGVYSQVQMGAVKIGFAMVGDPMMIPTEIVEIGGLKSFSGNYFLSNTKHSIGKGYSITAQGRRDGRSQVVGAGVASKKATNDQKAPETADGGTSTELETCEYIAPNSGQSAVGWKDPGTGQCYSKGSSIYK